MENIQTTKCPRCGGIGHVYVNVSIGAELKRLRKLVGMPLKVAACHFQDRGYMMSASYLSSLEKGFRMWNEEKIIVYRQIIGVSS